MQNLEQKLKTIIKTYLESDELGSIIEYAMFPAGKLFRPNLALAMAKDAGNLSSDHYLLAAAVETHHAYSLVHDDLPCMDDDDERRGRPATHIKYGEWKALLAGDAMLNLSYELLANMESPKAKGIISDFGKMMGARGLILGQFIDLSHKTKSLEQTLLMHELKTARLIQFSLMASLELSGSDLPKEEIEVLAKQMGINFQLLDDLGELIDEIDEHEDQVNAFLNYDPNEVLSLTSKNHLAILSIIEKHRLAELGHMYHAFMQKTWDKIQASITSVSEKSGLSEESLKQLFVR